MDKKNVLFGVMCDGSFSVEFSNILVVDGMISAGEHLFRGTDEPISGYAIHGGESPDYDAKSFSVEDALAYYGENLVMIEPGVSLEMSLDSGVDFGGNVVKRENGVTRFFSKFGRIYEYEMKYSGIAVVKFFLK